MAAPAEQRKCNCDYPWPGGEHDCYMERRTFGILDDLELAMVEEEEAHGECDCPCHHDDFDDDDANYYEVMHPHEKGN